jgi:hypothetical protein
MTPRRRGSQVGFTTGEKKAMAELYRAGVTFRPATGARGWRAEATA